jgi:SpoVK/Ycf46/Vps4 family AAA+-type ATPase
MDSTTYDNDFWERLVDMAESMTGAEIVGACRDAARLALRQMETNADSNQNLCISISLIESALQNVQPLLRKEDALHEFQIFEAHHKR